MLVIKDNESTEEAIDKLYSEFCALQIENLPENVKKRRVNF